MAANTSTCVLYLYIIVPFGVFGYYGFTEEAVNARSMDYSPHTTQKKLRVLLLSRYEHAGASTRVRSLQYLPFLAEHGIAVAVSPLLSDRYVHQKHRGERMPYLETVWRYIKRLGALMTAWRYDILWIEKELFPGLPAFAETLLARLGMPYVVDLDDAVFHRYDQHSNALYRACLKHKIDRVMGSARVVIAGNEYLADRARRAGAQSVTVIPSVIDERDYQEISKLGTADIFRIGWLGSPTTAPYLENAVPLLRRFSQTHSMMLVVVGAEQKVIEDVPVEYRDWSEATEVRDVCTFDVGIMPLPDDLWERGKCGHKLIKYMACGLPVVASPVGVNVELVDHGVNGFLASTDDEWQRALAALYADHVLRERMGEAGRRKARRYTVQAMHARLRDALYAARP